MTIATDTVEEIRDAAQELVDAAEELLNIREAERGEYTPEDRETALEEFESACRVLVNIPKMPEKEA